MTGGFLLLPDFLHAFGRQNEVLSGESCLVFIQLNGGNDGLNTFIPYSDDLYYKYRPSIALPKDNILEKNKGMGFHPALKGMGTMLQNGDLSVIQNVGYPNPNRSHFRSQEIWQTASATNEYLNEGWLGRYLDLQCREHQPTAGINLDNTDVLALRGKEPNSVTIKNPQRFLVRSNHEAETEKLSTNPQLDFVRKIANSVTEGSESIQKALAQATASETAYPQSGLGKNLEWIAKLIKGNLGAKTYYTSLSGFDTHDNQLGLHKTKLTELNDAVFSFYTDLKRAGLLPQVTTIVFSEFGRRVKDNGNGTDHGTAAPMFVFGGGVKGSILGKNPNLADLDNSDLKHDIDFRSVYATLLQQKLQFAPATIGLKNGILNGLF